MSADLLFEITKAQTVFSLRSYSSSRSALKSNMRLLSCYLVISLYSPRAMPCYIPGGVGGVQQIPRAIPLIHNTRPTMTAGEKQGGGAKNKKVHFMFELEQRGISSWPYTVMTSLINQMHNSWEGNVCCGSGGGEDRTASSALSWREDGEEPPGACICAITNTLCMCLTRTLRQKCHCGQSMGLNNEMKRKYADERFNPHCP